MTVIDSDKEHGNARPEGLLAAPERDCGLPPEVLGPALVRLIAHLCRMGRLSREEATERLAEARREFGAIVDAAVTEMEMRA